MKTIKFLFFFIISFSTVSPSLDETYHSQNKIIKSKNIKRTLAALPQESVNTNKNRVEKKKEIKNFSERNLKETKIIYQKMSAYPPTTAPMDSKVDIDPIEEKYTGQSLSTIGNEGKSSLRVVTEKTFFNKEETIELKIHTSFLGKPIPAKISILLNGKKVDQLIEVKKGEYNLEVLPFERMAESLYFDISAAIGKEEAFTSVSLKRERNILSFIDIESADIDSKGNLVFKTKFEVIQSGKYSIRGTLYDNDGNLIGKATGFKELQLGYDSIDLSFYGYLFTTKKINGPYILKNIELNKVSNNLSFTSNNYFEVNYETETFRYDQFHNSPYNDEILLSKIQKLK